MSGARHPWWVGPAAALGALILRLLGGTGRLDRSGRAAQDAERARGARCIFALWHARMLPLVFTHRGRGVTMLVSRHRDGELITRLIERLGYTTARGSSTRGGEAGAREMLESAGEGRMLGITPDGPRGPAEIVKPGLVRLASLTGLPVLPVASASRSTWVLRSWDRFRVPRPFARVTVGYGDPIRVPPELSAEEAERWRVTIEQAMRANTEAVRRRAGEAE